MPTGSPLQQQAGAIFVGATRYNSPLAWLRLSKRWSAMIRGLQEMPGYLHHQVYWDPPFALGTIGYFATREDLLTFARSDIHRGLMQWVTDGTKHATAGYIRLYDVPTGDAAGSAGDQQPEEEAPDAHA